MKRCNTTVYVRTFLRLILAVCSSLSVWPVLAHATEIDDRELHLRSVLNDTKGTDPRLQESVREDFSGDSWKNSVKETYTYNTDGLLYYRMGYTWASSAWQESDRMTYLYNSDSTVAAIVLEQKAGSWTFTEKQDYTYVNKKVVSMVKYRWQNFTWVNSQKIENTYDGSSDRTEELTLQWLANAWANMFKLVMTYDTAHNLIASINNAWTPTNEWNEAGKKLFTYDSNGYRIEELTQTKQDGNWKDYGKITMRYDTAGNTVELLNQIYENNAWQNSQKSLFVYGYLGKLTQESYYLWAGDSFAIQHRITYRYEGQTAIDKKNTGVQRAPSRCYAATLSGGTILIRFAVDRRQFVSLSLCNAQGKILREAVSSVFDAGNHAVLMNSRELAGGIYFVILRMSDGFFVEKLPLIK